MQELAQPLVKFKGVYQNTILKKSLKHVETKRPYTNSKPTFEMKKMKLNLVEHVMCSS